MKVRKDVYKLPEGDKTLEWYGKAIAEMKKRDASDPTSWAFQGAIHGFGLDKDNSDQYKYWHGYAPFPEEREVLGFWQQCQHQTWFFLPWHRMYLAYFEQIVGQTIIDLGGPKDWALPFWNYSDKSNPDRLNIPPSFTSPAESDNPLWLTGRVNTVDADSTTLEKLDIDFFTSRAGHTGFGGDITPFSHGGDWSFGGLEDLPHNHIHVDIEGAMIDPATAALDPIFWLHHANIDRLWQVWLNKGNQNPTNPEWLNFAFNFHDKNKETASMTPRDVLDTTKVLTGYTYEGVPSTPEIPPLEMASLRDTESMPIEVVGATEKEHAIEGKKSNLKVRLAPSSAKKEVLKTLKAPIELSSRKKLYLRFENVKGTSAAPVLSVYINVPQGGETEKQYYAGSLALFGLRQATQVDRHSSGSGISTQLEVTTLVEELRQLDNWNESELDVTIQPKNPNKATSQVTFGRVSLYSE